MFEAVERRGTSRGCNGLLLRNQIGKKQGQYIPANWLRAELAGRFDNTLYMQALI